MSKYKSGFSVGRRSPVTVAKDDPRVKNVNLYSSRSGRDINVISFQTPKSLSLGTPTTVTQGARASSWYAASNWTNNSTQRTYLFDGVVGDNSSTGAISSSLSANQVNYLQLSGFSLSNIPETFSSVTVTIKHGYSGFNTWASMKIQPYVGTTAISTDQTITGRYLGTTAGPGTYNGLGTNSFIFTDISYSDLMNPDFGIRYTATRSGSAFSSASIIAFIDIYVSYQETS